MRRTALLGLMLILSGCARYAGNPFDGFGGFVADTHNYQTNPNRPLGNSDNMRRVQGLPATSEPLLPEPGNVWPGPVQSEPTLGDYSRMSPDEVLKPGAEMNMSPRGSSIVPPGSTNPDFHPPAQGPAPAPPVQPAPTSRMMPTPSGTSTTSGGPGVQTYTDPKGQTGLMVPNGNGTSTLIAPDGTVQTVQTPK